MAIITAQGDKSGAFGNNIFARADSETGLAFWGLPTDTGYDYYYGTETTTIDGAIPIGYTLIDANTLTDTDENGELEGVISSIKTEGVYFIIAVSNNLVKASLPIVLTEYSNDSYHVLSTYVARKGYYMYDATYSFSSETGLFVDYLGQWGEKYTWSTTAPTERDVSFPSGSVLLTAVGANNKGTLEITSINTPGTYYILKTSSDSPKTIQESSSIVIKQTSSGGGATGLQVTATRDSNSTDNMLGSATYTVDATDGLTVTSSIFMDIPYIWYSNTQPTLSSYTDYTGISSASTNYSSTMNISDIKTAGTYYLMYINAYDQITEVVTVVVTDDSTSGGGGSFATSLHYTYEFVYKDSTITNFIFSGIGAGPLDSSGFVLQHYRGYPTTLRISRVLGTQANGYGYTTATAVNFTNPVYESGSNELALYSYTISDICETGTYYLIDCVMDTNSLPHYTVLKVEVIASTTPADPVQLATPTLSLAATRNTITPTIGAVTHASSYKLRYATITPTGNGTTWTTGTAITDLDPGTTYNVQVCAVGDGTTYLDSDWSTAQTITTPANVAPTAITLTGATDNAKTIALITGQSTTYDAGALTVTDADDATHTLAITSQIDSSSNAVTHFAIVDGHLTFAANTPAGVYTVTVTATDSFGATGNQAFEITVLATLQPLTSFNVVVTASGVVYCEFDSLNQFSGSAQITWHKNRV